MNFRVFAVFDDKAKAFLPPFFLPETGQAIRAFRDAVNGDRTHEFAKHPEDYTLFQVSMWDSSTGLFAQGFAPELILSALQVKE